MYDVIVVGARVAGSATGMLLARAGLRVLVVDQATFPSDTLSTHQVQVPGIARLRRWGLLERLIASNAPATRQVRFDTGETVLDGHYPEFDGVDAMFSPRRTVLDALLIDAAREAGAEVREGFIVDEVLTQDGHASGIRGARKAGTEASERARLVIGADGKRSLVARAVHAAAYRQTPPLSMACYTYWEGVPVDGGEIYGRERRAVGVWPTNDGMVMTYLAWPAEEFAAFRADVEGNAMRTFDRCGDLGERLRAGRRTEHFRTSPDLPNHVRVAYGPGWALVGDAGLVMDPVTGQGIGDAFRDAEFLADAVVSGFGGARPMTEALAEFQRRRDEAVLPMYEFTTDLASFHPPRPEEQLLFRSLEGNQAQIDRFLGMLTGAVPIAEYMNPKNLARIVGVRGMVKMAWGRARASRSKAKHPEPVVLG